MVSPGQQTFERKADRMPHFTVMPCFNAEGIGPRPMLVVPNLQSARIVFQGLADRCLITTSPNGWVVAETWVEWTTAFCEWIESYRERLNAPNQTVILFVDSAPTRGNLEALAIFRQHNVMVVTFPPHLTHVLQPVDVAWARRFKSQFREALRSWSKDRSTAALQTQLGLAESEVSPTMTRRAQVVAAAVDAAHSATTRVVCMTAFAIAGLVCPNGAFMADAPLASPYVQMSDIDPETEARIKQGRKRVFISSRVLTSDEAISELEGRKLTKPLRKAGRIRRAVVDIPPPTEDAAEDDRTFMAEDGPAFQGWTNAAVRAAPPDLEEEGVIVEPRIDLTWLPETAAPWVT